MPAGAEHAGLAGPRQGQPFDRHAGRGPGAQLAQAIGLDQGFEPAGRGVVQPDEELGPAARGGVDLPADQAQIVGRGAEAVQHDARRLGPRARHIVGPPAAELAKRLADHFDGQRHVDELLTSTSVR